MTFCEMNAKPSLAETVAQAQRSAIRGAVGEILCFVRIGSDLAQAEPWLP